MPGFAAPHDHARYDLELFERKVEGAHETGRHAIMLHRDQLQWLVQEIRSLRAQVRSLERSAARAIEVADEPEWTGPGRAARPLIEVADQPPSRFSKGVKILDAHESIEQMKQLGNSEYLPGSRIR
jgi:hypothetical protein